MPVDKLKKEALYKKKVQARRQHRHEAVRRVKKLERERTSRNNSAQGVEVPPTADKKASRELRRQLQEQRLKREQARQIQVQLELEEREAEERERARLAEIRRQEAQERLRRELVGRALAPLVIALLGVNDNMIERGVLLEGEVVIVRVADLSFAKRTRAFVSRQGQVQAVLDRFLQKHRNLGFTVTVELVLAP